MPRSRTSRSIWSGCLSSSALFPADTCPSQRRGVALNGIRESTHCLTDTYRPAPSFAGYVPQLADLRVRCLTSDHTMQWRPTMDTKQWIQSRGSENENDWEVLVIAI